MGGGGGGAGGKRRLEAFSYRLGLSGYKQKEREGGNEMLIGPLPMQEIQ